LCIEGVIFHMLVLGHRGASASYPENTVIAFRGALDQGADGVELDVRRTADGGLAISHDGILPDGRALVDVATTDLPAGLPVLDEVLDACRAASVVNIEIKNWPGDGDFDPSEGLAADVVALLEARGELADGRALVSSFHLPTVDRVHELAPGLATAWLLFDASDPGPLIDRAAEHGHVAIHPHHAFVTPDLVTMAHGAGLAVNVWTVDDPDRIVWLGDLGVDAVVVNDPELALRALGR
jgi:glycerophosphoryl diester phosphodiesterase